MSWPSPFIRCLPIRQDILNISQIAGTFHGIRPPLFIQTWLQQYSRGAFLYSACCSVTNPICFWTVRGRRTMILRQTFTDFAKLQGIGSVNVFSFPSQLQELLQAPFSFLGSFCLSLIRLKSLSCQVLHHDDISMIVSRYVSFRWEDFVICCNQITKIFCTRYGSTNTSSARGRCNFSPLTDFANSVCREMSINTVLIVRYHFSLRL